MDHGLISQLLADSEEALGLCSEKMQVPAQYSWSADWSFWVMCLFFQFVYLSPSVCVYVD